MDGILGLLKITICRGINLPCRDIGISDPYAVITMGDQKLKTKVVKNNCNPEWNEELTFEVTDFNSPIRLTVFDKDTFTADDEMGEAEIELKPLLASLHQMGLENLSSGRVISRVLPNNHNCLADVSCIVWWGGGKIIQDMLLKLKNVESGEVQVELEWIHVPGFKI